MNRVDVIVILSPAHSLALSVWEHLKVDEGIRIERRIIDCIEEEFLS